jgi:hypothetical protein
MLVKHVVTAPSPIARREVFRNMNGGRGPHVPRCSFTRRQIQYARRNVADPPTSLVGLDRARVPVHTSPEVVHVDLGNELLFDPRAVFVIVLGELHEEFACRRSPP